MKAWLPFIIAAVILTVDLTSKKLVYEEFDPNNTIHGENAKGWYPKDENGVRRPIETVIERPDPENERLVDWLGITLTINTGMIFGLFNDVITNTYARQILLASFMLLAFGMVIYLLWTIPKKYTIPRIAIGFVMGGALGNMSDRLFGYMIYQGKWDIPFPGVVDWVVNPHPFDFAAPWGDRIWPIWNVADASILIGLITLMFIMLFTKQGKVMMQSNKKKKKETEAEASESAKG